MKTIIAMFAALLLLTTTHASAQEARPYKDGPVTALSYIKVKNGRFDDYMTFLDTSYKPLMEAYKKAGLITGYAVYSATARTPQDPDLILSVTYANMAALDRTDEFDVVSQKVAGSNAAQNKASIDRDAMRTPLGGDLIRELVLK